MFTKTAPKPLRLLTHDEILGADDLITEDVETPEWGGPGSGVRVKALSGSERDKFQAGFLTFGPSANGGMKVVSVDRTNAMARLAALSVVDADGKRLFSDADFLALGDKSAIALERVTDVAMRLSGLTAQTVEALKEGLKETQNGSSGSE
jgi:hypothetical protein